MLAERGVARCLSIPGFMGIFLLRFRCSLGLTGVSVAVCDGMNGMAGEMDAAWSHLGS